MGTQVGAVMKDGIPRPVGSCAGLGLDRLHVRVRWIFGSLYRCKPRRLRISWWPSEFQDRDSAG